MPRHPNPDGPPPRPSRSSGRISRCANCGAEVANWGKTGPDGKRYCSKRPECRRAKWKNDRLYRKREFPPAMETRPCSGCGRDLPARPKRPTDLEEGRWCGDYRCRKAKDRFLAAEAARAEARAAVERGEAVPAIKTARDVFLETISRPVICEECGRTDVAYGFMHPTPDMAVEPCRGPEDPRNGIRIHRVMPPLTAAEILETWSAQ